MKSILYYFWYSINSDGINVKNTNHISFSI